MVRRTVWFAFAILMLGSGARARDSVAGASAALGAGLVVEDKKPGGAAGEAAEEAATTTVRDKLWLFGMPVKDRGPCRCGPCEGRPMTTMEAAAYLGIANALFVVQADFPEPPFDSYARVLAPLERVVWSILGDSRSERNDLDEVIRLAEKFPNITGGILDDFFRRTREGGRPPKFSLQDVEELRDRLHGAARKLDLWVVIYAHELDMPADEYLARCDVVTFWNWWASGIGKLEEDLARLEAKAQGKPIMLGCYFTDYGGGRQMPMELMERQCELGLKWLEEGRIEGIIFLGNPMCGMGMESVEWTRQWIAEVGDRPLRIGSAARSAEDAAQRPVGVEGESSENKDLDADGDIEDANDTFG
jgi:hypothetical protein